MSSKRTLTCPLPDGTVATRTTARTYSHVFASFNGERWGAIAWAGRLDLAFNQRSRWEHLVHRNPEARLAIIEIETGKVVWEHEGHIRVAKPEPVAPVAKPEPAPVPSAPREPKPSRAFKTPSDVQWIAVMGLQPGIVQVRGHRGALQHVANVLVEDGVTERRVRNALDGWEHLDELLTLMDEITIDS